MEENMNIGQIICIFLIIGVYILFLFMVHRSLDKIGEGKKKGDKTK